MSTQKTYSIFGAGAAGLYTAWRLLNGERKSPNTPSRLLEQGDTLELYDWGQYDFSRETPGSRAPGARVCTWHMDNDPNKSYLELGGMRYAPWDFSAPDCDDGKAPGHRLVTTVIHQLGLDKYAIPFNESVNPLYYLRSKNFYLNDISAQHPAPYYVDRGGATQSPDQGFSTVEEIAVTKDKTRREWDQFYRNGKIAAELPATSIFKKGDPVKNIGYWNLLYDQLGGEGYAYCSDGNGYSSNVINWNSADAMQANNEFTPGSGYKTLTTGYSGMFTTLFAAIVKLAAEKGVRLDYQPNRRLHSILQVEGAVVFGVATREQPHKKAISRRCDAAWLAMPRCALELVAQATRYEQHEGVDVLNHEKVQLYLESAITQPSYKVGMFFGTEWWRDTTTAYPPQLTGFEVTTAVLASLKASHFPPAYLAAIQASTVLDTPYSSITDFLGAVEKCVPGSLTPEEKTQLLAAARSDTIGPSVTDTPIRQVVYFGNNAVSQGGTPAYGLLASYDDEMFTTFWQELELGTDEMRVRPISQDTQPLTGPRLVPPGMTKMLRRQLAELHFGPQADFSMVPEPLEARYMDWSLPPFNAGYHAWAAHYDIADVQQKIRKPSQLIAGADAPIFIVGEAYSNDQAWVEGAYCTAESVLNDFFDVKPLIENKEYPFICSID